MDTEKESRREPQMPPSSSYRVAVVEWIDEEDGLPQVIHDELARLGHQPTYLKHFGQVPENVDVVFSYAPYGKFIPIARQVGAIPEPVRPTLVHWNTEGMPDLRLPWLWVRFFSILRSWVGRLDLAKALDGTGQSGSLLSRFENRILRYRYIGDYYYAYRKGWLSVYADSSAVYAGIHRNHGLPTIVAPWGGTPLWYEDLALERDIDVLWMGKYGSRRRRILLTNTINELRARGLKVHVADNVENPFIFGKERTRYLNRARVTLNITRTWYDDNYSRFAMAAPNRSLIVSEPLLPHCPEYVPGVHYVSAPIEKIPETILAYLENDAARNEIIENAYKLVTTELAFQHSIRKIMDKVTEIRSGTPNALPAD